MLIPFRSSTQGAAPALLGLTAPLLTACSSGAVEVDQTRPGEQYEFPDATPVGTVIPLDQRASAPALEGELIDESPYSSTSLEGDVAVLDFWGSWCAARRVETPEFQAVHEDVADGGVQFLGIDVKDQRQLTVAFVEGVGATYPSLFDPRGEVDLAFRGFPANIVPSTILLDRAGRVAAVYTGAVDEEELRGALTVLLDEGGS